MIGYFCDQVVNAYAFLRIRLKHGSIPALTYVYCRRNGLCLSIGCIRRCPQSWPRCASTAPGPDLTRVGEIWDLQTFEAVIRVTERSHLVLAAENATRTLLETPETRFQYDALALRNDVPVRLSALTG